MIQYLIIQTRIFIADDNSLVILCLQALEPLDTEITIESGCIFYVR